MNYANLQNRPRTQIRYILELESRIAQSSAARVRIWLFMRRWFPKTAARNINRILR